MLTSVLPVRHVSHQTKPDEAPDVDRYGEEICVDGAVTHTGNDSWKKGRKTVQRHVN